MGLRSIFQIIGPVMVGPSSSHTAGAVKIGKKAYDLLKDEPKKVKVTLYGSYARGFRGHKTDIAVLGGCLGFEPGDERVRDSVNLSERCGVEFILKTKNNPVYHTNTAEVDITGISGRRIYLRGSSIGGGMVTVDDFKDYNADTCGNSFTFCGDDRKEVVVNGLETCAELVAEAQSKSCKLADIIISQEAAAYDKSPEEIVEMVKTLKDVMVKAIDDGLKGDIESIGRLTDNDGRKVIRAIAEKKLLGGDLFSEVMAGAMAVNESNTAMGVVAAAPTGGACGILPGAVLGAAKLLKSSEEEIIKSLVTAGGIGARIASQTSLSASVAGCQVEIGVGSGMAAVAVAELSGCKPSECADAAAIAMKSFIGLTCGALGGLCEVPCVKRNGIAATSAISAVNMVLAGVTSQLPFDEVIEAMADTGRRIPDVLLGTTLTGLAGTKTGRKVYDIIYPENEGSDGITDS